MYAEVVNKMVGLMVNQPIEVIKEVAIKAYKSEEKGAGLVFLVLQEMLQSKLSEREYNKFINQLSAK